MGAKPIAACTRAIKSGAYNGKTLALAYSNRGVEWAYLQQQLSSGVLSFTAGTGAFTFTPAVGFAGDVTFTYKVTDPYGLASAPATVTIHVNAVPVAVGSFLQVSTSSQRAQS